MGDDRYRSTTDDLCNSIIRAEAAGVPRIVSSITDLGWLLLRDFDS